MKRLSLIIFVLIILAVVPVMAADCPALVQQALTATDTMCRETEKNQACYGNINLSAKPTFSAENFRFNQPGDRVSITDIKSLQLSPMTVATGEWGVALMNIEASLPASKPADITLLAFGDVTLENTAASPTALDVNAVGVYPINVRLLPNMNAGVVGSLKPDQTVTAIERLVDGSWLRVQLPDSEQMGWVSADFIRAAGDVRTLNIVDGSQPHYRPMQAFTFRSGNESQSCAEIPENGLIIQTPEGSGEVQLWINQVVVKLGSTVYFQAQPNSDMVVTTLEGHATVEAKGVTYTAAAGSSVSIKLDGDMNAAEAPRMPEAYAMADVANLPITHLGRKIAIHEPLTPTEIVDVQQVYSGNGDITSSNNGGNTNSNGNGNNNNCPGNSCHNGTNNNNGNVGENCPKDDKGPGPKDHKCPKDPKDPKDDKGPGPKDPKDDKDSKGPKDPKDDKDKGPKGPKDDKDKDKNK